MAIIPADRHEFDKTLPLSRCSNSRQCNAWKATVSSPACSPQLGPPGITQVSTGGWGAPSCSGVMKWFCRSVVCLIWWETDLCPWPNLSCNQGGQWALFVLNLLWFFTLCSFSTILFQLPSTYWCVRVLLESWSSEDCCQLWYWKCR